MLDAGMDIGLANAYSAGWDGYGLYPEVLLRMGSGDFLGTTRAEWAREAADPGSWNAVALEHIATLPPGPKPPTAPARLLTDQQFQALRGASLQKVLKTIPFEWGPASIAKKGYGMKSKIPGKGGADQVILEFGNQNAIDATHRGMY